MGTSEPKPSTDHFSAVAGEYATHRPGYPTELARALAEASPETGSVWEVGCGSGQLTFRLASRFRRVWATDLSRSQLAQAPPLAGVLYVAARAEECPLSGASVDLIVAAQAAHWFDLDSFYAEVRRVARPGALLALVSYGLMRISPEVDRVVHRFHQETLAPHWPPERRHVDAGYRTLPFPFPRVTMPALECRVEWSLERFLGYVETWSGVGRLVADGGAAELAALRREVTLAWGDPSQRPIRWPLHILSGRVEAD